MTQMLQDVRLALRALGKSPAFTLAAIAVLALGIGVTTAVFQLFDALLLRPLAVPEPSRLVRVQTLTARGPGVFSYPNLRDLRAADEALYRGLAAFAGASFGVVAGDGPADRVDGTLAGGDYFVAVGLRPALGRFFDAADAAPGQPAVAVLGHGYWTRRLAADPAVIGRAITVNGQPATVIGVAPPGFRGTELDAPSELWLPLSQVSLVYGDYDALGTRQEWWLHAIGRLAPGVALDTARAAAAAAALRLAETYPEINEGVGATVEPITAIAGSAAAGLTPVLRLLAWVVAAVLLTACANAANLLLTRTERRRRELAIRAALGASARRLVLLVATETGLVALASAAVGLVLALWGVELMSIVVPPALRAGVRSGLEPRALGFALGLALLAGAFTALVPALRARRSNLVGDLGGGLTHLRLPMRKAFLVAQVALSVVLLIVAGLLVRTMQQVLAVDPGFRSEEILALRVDPAAMGIEPAQAGPLYEQLIEEIAASPGVRGVSAAQLVPLGYGDIQREAYAEGAGAEQAVAVNYNRISRGHFATLGIPLLAGRDFDRRDTAAAPPVAILSRSAASRLWPGQAAVGKRFSNRGPEGPFMEVIGVADDTRTQSPIESPRPYLYLPHNQNPVRRAALLVRTEGDPAAHAEAVRATVQRAAPMLPVYGVEALDAYIARTLWRPRMATRLLGVFSVLALALAAVGLYGTLSYLVAQRQRELGIRAALGATGERLVGLVLRQGLGLVAIGLALGVAGAWLASSLVAGLLFGVTRGDPLAYLLALGTLLATAFLACALPAWRAGRVDPIRVLRYQ